MTQALLGSHPLHPDIFLSQCIQHECTQRALSHGDGPYGQGLATAAGLLELALPSLHLLNLYVILTHPIRRGHTRITLRRGDDTDGQDSAAEVSPRWITFWVVLSPQLRPLCADIFSDGFPKGDLKRGDGLNERVLFAKAFLNMH